MWCLTAFLRLTISCEWIVVRFSYPTTYNHHQSFYRLYVMELRLATKKQEQQIWLKTLFKSFDFKRLKILGFENLHFLVPWSPLKKVYWLYYMDWRMQPITHKLLQSDLYRLMVILLSPPRGGRAVRTKL